MARRLTDQQLAALAAVTGVHRLLLTPGRTERALAARGLLSADEGGACCVTPAGLRALAEAMEAGRLQDAHQTWAEMRRAKADG